MRVSVRACACVFSCVVCDVLTKCVFERLSVRLNVVRLGMSGLRFTQFYSAAPICTPSRASLMTGRLPIRTGVYTNYSYPIDEFFRVFLPSSVGCLPENETTIATHLSAGGYYSALIGKWHIGEGCVCVATVTCECAE